MDKAVNHEHNNPVFYKRDLVFTKLVVDKWVVRYFLNPFPDKRRKSFRKNMTIKVLIVELRWEFSAPGCVRLLSAYLTIQYGTADVKFSSNLACGCNIKNPFSLKWQFRIYLNWKLLLDNLFMQCSALKHKNLSENAIKNVRLFRSICLTIDFFRSHSENSLNCSVVGKINFSAVKGAIETQFQEEQGNSNMQIMLQNVVNTFRRGWLSVTFLD
jgi:hypothetical protein